MCGCRQGKNGCWGNQLRVCLGFLGGRLFKNLPSSGWDTGSIPSLAIKIPHAVSQLSPLAATTEPKHSRACAPQLEKTQRRKKNFKAAVVVYGLPRWLSGKESTSQCRRCGFNPRSGRCPEGNGNLLQYTCLENSTDRGVWWATFHGSQRVGHA